jgi:Fic family protein
LHVLIGRDRERIGGLGRATASALRVHQALVGHPVVTSGWLVDETGLSPATINKALAHLERFGVVKEMTARKRNRLFCYAEYVEIMNRGTELP